MKYIKLFESKYNFSLYDFLKKMSEYYRYYNRKSLIIDNMNYIKFPNIFEEEYMILYYLYDDDWKTDDKLENNYIKRKIKDYVKNLIYKKIESESNLVDLISWFHEIRPRWYNSKYFQYVGKKNENILWNFYFFYTHDERSLKIIKNIEYYKSLNKKINNYNL
jgi:hypothetical protein